MGELSVELVSDNCDPLRMGRIQLNDGRWVTLAASCQIFSVPPKGSKVLVHGDHYIGIIWNPYDAVTTEGNSTG
jgi:hypothetical protein